MRSQPRRRLACFALIAVACTLLVLTPATVGLMLAPALLAALPLLLGRYPGEELLARMARRAPAASPPQRLLPRRAPRRLGRRLSPLAAVGASRAPPLPA